MDDRIAGMINRLEAVTSGLKDLITANTKNIDKLAEDHDKLSTLVVGGLDSEKPPIVSSIEKLTDTVHSQSKLITVLAVFFALLILTILIAVFMSLP